MMVQKPQKPRIKNIISGRSWNHVRDGWLGHVPVFASLGAQPDPGLEGLHTLQDTNLPNIQNRVADIAGVRRNMLWEAIFLFQKCAHCHLAAQRLGMTGMHSWSMFNAYHAAYLGARGLMALLGIALPYLPSVGQLLIDGYPPAESKTKSRKIEKGLFKYEELLIVKIGGGTFGHADLWEAFQRLLQMAVVNEWNPKLRDELVDLDVELIARPRNAFMYKAASWPMDDLLGDRSVEQFMVLLGTELDTAAQGFLLRSSCNIYRLFEQLIVDLAERSGPIRSQVDGSRIISNPEVDELRLYNKFIAQV